jgi:hypothetical protein
MPLGPHGLGHSPWGAHADLYTRAHTHTHTHLNSLVEDAGADLNHLQVLLLLIPCTLDVGHPASVVLLAGINEVSYCAILIEHLGTGGAETR